MNPAEVATALLVERTLSTSPAYRKIDDSLYVVKQGSTYVLLNIRAWGPNRAVLQCVAQLVRGVKMTGDLARQLLELNAHLRFGAFAYSRKEKVVLFQHTLLGGADLDTDELRETVREVAIVADSYDDQIRDTHGGQTMADLLEEAVVEHVLERDPDAIEFRSPTPKPE